MNILKIGIEPGIDWKSDDIGQRCVNHNYDLTSLLLEPLMGILKLISWDTANPVTKKWIIKRRSTLW